MNIIFVRHSHTVINKDLPNRLRKLSDKGIELASKLAESSLLVDVDAYYTSPQLKATHTTAILASEHPAPLHMIEGIDESTSITNKRIEEFESEMKKYFSDSNYSINGGETIEEALKRFIKTIEDIVVRSKEKGYKCIAIVTHGTMLSLFTADIIKESPYETHHKINMPDIASFDRESKKFTHHFGK